MYEWLNDIFGIELKVVAKEQIKGLPIYLTVGRQFYYAKDEAVEFLIVALSDEEKFGVVALEKQRIIFEEKFIMSVTFAFDSLSVTQRNSLIRHRIAFIGKQGQCYLPFLGTYIESKTRKPKSINTDKMMPVTQSLFLYLLYECKNKKIMKKDAAEKIKATRTSITRASEQLKNMGLICEETKGKETYMYTEIGGYQLFKKAQKYLISPVKAVVVAENKKEYDELPIASEAALARNTMLNAPKISSVAVDKDTAPSMNIKNVDERWSTDIDLIKVELWKYDPLLFSQNGIVDPVSLYMSLSSIEDERVEGCLEEMMEEYKW